MVFDADEDTPPMPSLRDAKAAAKGRPPPGKKKTAEARNSLTAEDDSGMRAVATEAIERERARRARRQAGREAAGGSRDTRGNGTGSELSGDVVSGDGWFDLRTNTSVYVSGLPLDAAETELVTVFSKCGVIKLDPDTDAPKVKLYRDAAGRRKGDALVTYLREPSVGLAVAVLDGAPFRDAEPEKKMTVTAAEFEMKGDAYVKKPRGSKKRKASALAKQAKQALDWGGFDDTKDRKKTTVILSKMFALEEMFSDPNFRDELEDDVRSECAKFGEVSAVKVFTTNPDGVVSVRFVDHASSEKCVEAMDGRWFGGLRIGARLWDGTTNHAEAGLRVNEDEAERAEGLEKIGEDS
jgi:HIV Tat-specific factor 1